MCGLKGNKLRNLYLETKCLKVQKWYRKKHVKISVCKNYRIIQIRNVNCLLVNWAKVIETTALSVLYSEPEKCPNYSAENNPNRLSWLHLLKRAKISYNNKQ